MQSIRSYSNEGVVVSDFATKKKGTGKGPFIELPELKSLQDSILIKLPSSCTIYGNLKNFNAISPDPRANGQTVLERAYDKQTGLSKLSTGQYPLNMIMLSPASMSSTAIIKIDSYTKGLFVPNFFKSTLCYGGDLSLDNQSGEVKGLGIVALAGEGPVYKMILSKIDTIMVSKETILAYDSNIKVHSVTLGSYYSFPIRLKTFFKKLPSPYSEYLTSLCDKIFNRDKSFCKINGPGILFLQTQSMRTPTNHA